MKITSDLPESEKIKRIEQSKKDKELHEKYLLSEDFKFKRKDTPLFDAVIKGDKVLISKLLDEGWDINHVGSLGRTPLYQAIFHNGRKPFGNTLIEFLISKGAVINQCAMAIGVTHLDVEMFINLLDRASITNDQLKNLFKVALVSDYEKKMFAIADRIDGNFPEAINIYSGTEPIFFKYILNETLADANYSRQKIRMLIDRGLDFSYKTTKDIDFLHMAIIKNDFDLARLLISKGANIQTVDRNNNSLLITTLSDPNRKWLVNKVKFLVDNKIKVNAKNKDGDTALISLIRNCYAENQDEVVEVINLLISSGASINAKNNKGVDALTIATRRGLDKVKLALQNAGADELQSFLKQSTGEMFKTAILTHRLDLIESIPLDKLTSDINKDIIEDKNRYFYKVPPLKYAADLLEKYPCDERKEVVEKLLDMGAQFITHERYFFYANKTIFTNYEDLAVMLIEKGAYFIKNFRSYRSEDSEDAPLVFHAVYNHKNKLALCLLNKHDELFYNKHGLWLLSLAIKCENTFMVDKLIGLLDFKKCYKHLKRKYFIFLPRVRSRSYTRYFCDPLITAIDLDNLSLITRLINAIGNENINVEKYILYINSHKTFSEQTKEKLCKLINEKTYSNFWIQRKKVEN